MDADVGRWKYFHRHESSWFPQLGSRSTFAQQAANLWVVKQRLHQQQLIDLDAARDPMHLVETVIGQLAVQFHFEKIRARDAWRLTSRMAGKVLAHTFGIFMNQQIDRPDLQFEGLIA